MEEIENTQNNDNTKPIKWADPDIGVQKALFKRIHKS